MAELKFQTHLSKFNSPLWGHHILVPDDISEHFLSQNIKRLVCRLNNKIDIQCALMPTGEETHFININKEVRSKLGLRVGDVVQAQLKEDKSKYGLPMPEEFQELLNQDEEGHLLFHKLTPGKQRNLLYIVGSPKQSNTRLKKALVVVQHLKTQNGKIDFKQLNVEMKGANKRFP